MVVRYLVHWSLYPYGFLCNLIRLAFEMEISLGPKLVFRELAKLSIESDDLVTLFQAVV